MSLLTPQHNRAIAEVSTAEHGTVTRSEHLASRYYHPRLIGQCANPACRSGWLHLFRSRTTPIFEEGWTCSPECTEARVWLALRREMDGSGPAREPHRHRIPLGLLMLEQGWITRQQFRRALEAQKKATSGRIGEWLVQQCATDEATVTRALGLQWSSPVLSPDSAALLDHNHVPRLFLDAFGALPLRLAAGKVLYLGFEEYLDSTLALAIERLNGLRVENAFVPSSMFRRLHAAMLEDQFPPVQFAEASSLPAAAHLLARTVERLHPVASRLVHVHDYAWLRLWCRQDPAPALQLTSVFDVVCSFGAS